MSLQVTTLSSQIFDNLHTITC